MSHYKENFTDRIKDGNKAEVVAEEFYCSNKYLRYKRENIYMLKAGINKNSDFSDVSGKIVPYEFNHRIPRVLRNIPDYVVLTDKGNYFLEGKGCKDVLKLKKNDVDSYGYWNKIMGVGFFILGFFSKEFCKKNNITDSTPQIYRFKYKELMRVIKEGGYSNYEYDDNNEKCYEFELADLTLFGESGIDLRS